MTVSLAISASVLVLCEPFFDEQIEQYGYLDCDGAVAVPAIYRFAYEFNEGGIAAVADESGWYYIDRSNQFVIKPMLYDNGPDYFSDGLSRFVKDGKYGYFDEFGKIVIEAQYDFAWPFKNGKAQVGEDCQFVPDGEHTAVKCSTRYSIDAPKMQSNNALH